MPGITGKTIYCEVISVDKLCGNMQNLPAIFINLGMPFELTEGTDPTELDKRNYMAYVEHLQEPVLAEAGAAVHRYGAIVISPETMDSTTIPYPFAVYDKTSPLGSERILWTQLLNHDGTTEVTGSLLSYDVINEVVTAGSYFVYGARDDGVEVAPSV